ncbi:LPXTG cell wall anchor domain-containing protein [Phaeacidiphilus oryzae]|uniref:LPXTG cell wall anchor domain-containing protein n=1 Tax=Phaeacidiphilus oryzae TaxID=348818 RepID=UPI0005666199|nr:LPXTG cell wall anchor domain-containing protein [Phaeacidiphilus oryzae]
MKLRRALVTVASTAALLPAALAAAPAAFADDSGSTPTVSATATDTPTASATTPPAETATTPAASASADPTGAASPSASATGTPGGTGPTATGSPTAGGTPTAPASATGTPTADPTAYCTDQNQAYQAALKISVAGLPGRIARGSGWHVFKLTLDNPTKKSITGVDLVAGVFNPNSGDPFADKQLKLQAYDWDAKQWFDVGDSSSSIGYLGPGDLPANTSADVRLRLNVESAAPLGLTVALGYGAYPDKADDCIAEASGIEKFKVVSAGSGTGGTATSEPGGQVPPPARQASDDRTKNHAIPARTTQAALTGSLAHTGSPSQLPLIGGIGGAAIVAGAGALLVVRRRKAGSAV